MKKYQPYIIITSVLLVIAVYFIFQDNSRTLRVDNRYFAIADTSKVSIIKAIKGKDTLLLEKSIDNWVVDNKYIAKSKIIKYLLGMFSTVEINSPVPGEIKEAIINEFTDHSLLLSFKNSTETLKSFRILDSDTFNIGSFAMMDGENDPYIIKIAGFDGRISKLFPMDKQIWRDKIVFRYQPYEILAIKIEYPQKSNASFYLDYSNPNKVAISTLSGALPKDVSRERAIKYLFSFASVPFDLLSNNSNKNLKDSLNNTIPVINVEVKTVSKQLNSVKVYRIPDQNKKGGFSMFKMYAVLQNDSIPVTVKFVDFDPIMKEYSDFIHE